MTATPRDSSKPKLKRPRLKSWAFKLIAMALSSAVALLVVEISLRLFASSMFVAQSDSPLVPSNVPGLGYQVAPNLSTAVTQTDENGLRRRNGPVEVQHKALLLGDSIAFASFIRYDRSFVPLLEEFLNERMEEPVGVWNAGTPGYNTTQQAVQLDVLSPIIKPEFVVLQYCMNDYLHGLRLTAGGQLDATGGGSDSGFSLAGLPNSSFAYIFFKEKAKDAQRLWPEWFPTWAHYIHYIDEKEGFKQSLESLSKIQATTKRIGAQLLVVIFPVEQQLRIGDRKVQDKLVQFAAANGIEVLDLYPALERRWREGLYVDFWNQAKMADKLHLNEHGHEVVAHEIGAYLIEKKAQFFRKVSSGRDQ